MKQTELLPVFRRLRREAKGWILPVIDDMARRAASPYRILMAALLSTRTRDSVTALAAQRLFAQADTPAAMIKLSEAAIRHAILPVAFSRTKAAQILKISSMLLEHYDGKVPDSLEALDNFPGVGRKVANLVINQAFGKPGICVDTHVHRITNRWGYVQSRTPNETEQVLRRKLPPRYWIEINPLLVAFGQNICLPTSPKCSICAVQTYCDRTNVTRSR